ncbi:uncharacterized protein LOC129755880 [Uranotaenia lowii]|uniref:uncharacterized protein LOC129755880 n=1 Tax=Uranotaenia lowii TaxID=190385 RepID=UPI00247AAA91|nr:uncharacterized protein LOC129755880 [Uranotaenia lowii]
MSTAAKIDALRKGFGKESTAAAAMAETKAFVDGITKQADQAKMAVYLFQELLRCYDELIDGSWQQAEALCEALRFLVDVCREAEDSIKCHFLLRTYNQLVNFLGKETKQHLLVRCAQLMLHCPQMDEHLDLYQRVGLIVLKIIYCFHGRKPKIEAKSDEGVQLDRSINIGLEYVTAARLMLVSKWACSKDDIVRAKAIAIYNEVFDNSMALLYRLFAMDQRRATEFYYKFVQIFSENGDCFSEKEMTDLLRGSIPYLETILSFGDACKPYLEFVGMLDAIQLRLEPARSYLKILKKYLEFLRNSKTAKEALIWIVDKLKDLSSSSELLLIDIIVFMTTQLQIHLSHIKEQALSVAVPVIDLCKLLIKFSKHCPRNVTTLCAKCPSSSRHLVDYISSMVISMAMMMHKSGKTISPEMVSLVNGFLKHKLLTLADLNCEKQRSLLDSGLRFVVNWIRVCISIVPGPDFLELTKLVIDFKYRYNFDYLTPSHLIRLVENIYRDSGPCREIIDAKLTRLLILVRDEKFDKEQAKELDEITFAITNFQTSGNQENLKELNIVELLERQDIVKFGFPFDYKLSTEEKIAVLLSEMNWISRYKPAKTMQYFNLLNELNTHPLKLGMTLYLLQDGSITQMSESILENLKVKLQKAHATKPAEQICRHGSLGILNYYAFGTTSKTIVNKLKNAQLNKNTFKDNQINGVLKENNMDQEMLLLDQLEQTYINYRQLVTTMADHDFQHFSLIFSLNQISSILDNTCRFYQICYHPRRAVEMQIMNYLLVNQKPDRALDLCTSLGYILENHQVYKLLINDPVYQKPWTPQLHTLAEKASDIIKTYEQDFSKVPESRKFAFLNLYLAMAQYESSYSGLATATKYLQTLANLINQLKPACSPIIRGKIYHTLFRLVANNNLQLAPQFSTRHFIRLMLTHFNELQKQSTDASFVVSTCTLEMTVDTLRYLIVDHDADRMEAYVEQILRFALRRGAGLRSMQIMLLYAVLSADGEKEDKCRMLLTYLDQLLMFRPIASDDYKPEDDKASADPKQIVLSDDYEGPFFGPLADDEDSNFGVDQTRKAAKQLHSPTKRSLSPNLFPENVIDGRHYLIQHHPGCSCQFCKYPQYKFKALFTATVYARVAFLKGDSAQCRRLYEAISEEWSYFRAALDNDNLSGYRDEFLLFMARVFMQYSQFLAGENQLQQATKELAKSESIVKSVPYDFGLLKEIQLSMATLRDVQNKGKATTSGSKFPSFAEFCKQERLDVSPIVEFNKMNLKTPKVGPNRLMPRTASKADDLQKLIVRKRLKNTLSQATNQDTELISAMSGLSCKSERKPKTVNIFVDSPVKELDKKQKLFAQEVSSEEHLSPKKRGRKKKTETETPAAAPKSTRKKRIPLSPSSSNESFKDALVKGLNFSTPKVQSYSNRITTRSTCKKPKLGSAFPKLKRLQKQSPEPVQNHSFNSSFRDVLLKSLTESNSKQLKPTNNTSVIVLDDSDDVINTSITEHLSINESSSGVLSLKKYSDRKAVNTYGSARKQPTLAITKTRLKFDDLAVVDITTPTGSPMVIVTPASSRHQKEPNNNTNSKGSPEVVKRARGRPPKAAKVVCSTSPPVGTTVRKKVRGRKEHS